MKNNDINTSTGIVGLGSMGIGMARNIIDSGIPLKGFDINPDSLSSFTEFGGMAAESAKEAAFDVDLLIIMVVDADQIRDVLFGKGDAARVMKTGGTILICSTVSPEFVSNIQIDIEKLGLSLVDAPVTGGKIGADTGKLTVMASGPPAAYEKAKNVLEAISSKIFNLSTTPGIGSTYKVVLQLSTGVHLATAAELMSLGVKAGCDPTMLYEIVSNSSGQSWMLDDRVPQMIKGEFSPRSMVDIFVKDLGLVLDLGQELNFQLPIGTAAYQIFKRASESGFGKLDDSAVVKVYENDNNCSVEQGQKK